MMVNSLCETFGMQPPKLRSGVLRGQASAEFIVIVPLFVFVVFFIMWSGFAFFERSTLVQRFSTLGNELPSGWETMADDDLVRNLIIGDGVLDDASLTVTGASVEVPPALVHTNADDPVATALGRTTSKMETTYVEIEAEVSYNYRSILSWSGSQTLTAHVERTYTIGQKYEIF